jgi:hypothetical protein
LKIEKLSVETLKLEENAFNVVTYLLAGCAMAAADGGKEEIPVIDISPLLLEGGTEEVLKTSLALSRACEEVGFFLITGIDHLKELRAELFQIGRNVRVH